MTAASLQWLPGAQARVFTVAHDGCYWTPVHLIGPIGHPHEDLAKRLIAAAAGELLDKNADQIIDAAKSLLDLIREVALLPDSKARCALAKICLSCSSLSTRYSIVCACVVVG